MWNRINNKSISFQLTLVISLFLVIAFTSIATLVYKNASEVLLEQTMQEHQSKLGALAETISGEFENFLENAHELEAAFRNGYMYDLSFDNETHNFAGYQVKDATVHGKSVINNSTIADNFTADTGAIATLFLASGNDYIRVATSLKNENGKRALGTMLGQNHPGYHSLKNGQPYYAKVDLFGHPYLTYYHPIKDSTGQVRALSFVGLPIEAATKAIFSTLSKIKWGDTGYTIVTDNDKARLGVYLYHPGNKKEGSSIIDYQDPEGNRPFGKAFEQKNGLIKYPFDVNGDTYEKYLVYAEIPGWNWKLFGGTYISEVTKGSQELLTVIIITSFVVGLLSLVVLSLFLKKKTQPLTTLAGYMDRLGDGEVSLSMEQGKRDSDNEIERLTYGVSSMAMKLNTLVGNIRSTSDSVQQQADIVSNEAGASLKQSEVQQEQVELVVTAIEEMASSAQSVAEQVENIATTVRSANEDSQSGSAVVGQMTTQIAELNEQLRQSADAIEMVNHESENIQTVTRMIDEIAEQTNLLALNAAIEAARAGEQGRGFAVVADEVRNLAHRTQESVKEVVKIIDQLRVSTSSAVAMMSESQSKGESVTQQATRTGEALDNITSQVMEIAAQSEAIAATSEEQAQVSQEIAASATQISNLNRDSHANAVQTESSATNLQKLSVNLTEQVAYFR